MFVHVCTSSIQCIRLMQCSENACFTYPRYHFHPINVYFLQYGKAFIKLSFWFQNSSYFFRHAICFPVSWLDNSKPEDVQTTQPLQNPSFFCHILLLFFPIQETSLTFTLQSWLSSWLSGQMEYTVLQSPAVHFNY